MAQPDTHIVARTLDRVSVILAALFALDRLLKLLAVAHFFRRRAPAAPTTWPSVSLIQPITRGPNNLQRALESRAVVDYPGAVRHVFVCDDADTQSQQICRALIAAHPRMHAALMTAPPDGGVVASKITKLHLALPHANGEILCFVDDDVVLSPETLRVLVAHLGEPRVGAAFGLACYTNWSNTWASLISAFVNANALLSYIPLVYMTEPYTITGHCFALRREAFEAAGGLDMMEERLDDDHELARRVRAIGLRCMQTPLIYEVDNQIDTARGYHVQMKRWFVFPRQMMVPFLTLKEQAVSLAGSSGMLLVPLLGLLALRRRKTPLAAFAAAMACFALAYGVIERVYTRRPAPARRWPLILASAVIAPAHIIIALLSGGTVEWRGQQLRVHPGGRFEVLL